MAAPRPAAARPSKQAQAERQGRQMAAGEATASGGPARYEIRVASVLDGCWAAQFEGLQVTSDDAETVICGVLTDQSALHGVLVKVRDLGLTLISLRRLGP
jgi:hypothetical protein